MTERDELRQAMFRDLFPGKKSHFVPLHAYPGYTHFKGLEGSPEIMQQTMLPNISPDKFAKLSVFLNSGHEVTATTPTATAIATTATAATTTITTTTTTTTMTTTTTVTTTQGELALKQES